MGFVVTVALTAPRGSQVHAGNVAGPQAIEWPMSQAQQYRHYAAECMRLADGQPQEREHWLMMAARWTALAAMAAKIEDR